MKQVPEDQVLSEEKQLRLLRKKLLGNQVFKDCRGRIGGNVFFRTIESTQSPTQFCSDWDNLSSKMRVMGNLLAVYRRNGWTYAYKALTKALASSSYLIPGEKVPLEQTVPHTLVMIHPEKTLTLINWLLNVHWMELNRYLDEKDDSVPLTLGNLSPERIEKNNEIVSGKYAFHTSGLTKKLFELFPSLEDFARQRRAEGHYEGRDLQQAYYQDVENIPGRFIDFDDLTIFYLSHGQWHDHIENMDYIAFAYLIPKQTKDVLKRFSRGKQDLLATWSFNVPKVCVGHIHSIGLHITNEHGRWARVAPVSRNISHGYGAVINAFDLRTESGYETSWQGQGGDKDIASRFILNKKL